ncbi:TetR/AcrR family transcriptional regulator [Rhodoferax sp.]|uniref:TetR/AcrR family transcriptional regulator n=1 Tax=Rhodoferax sp. TaxID=50421 RepID=UPI00284856D1|nr:TetR/AcrR family transcriptional regulator [Rhodoferax sp.]MDR3367972.1 TetR/AcrR family transcriptional regulator [Rhodoferax sp.]
MKVRTEARREAILEIASQVFLEFGFKRASMDEIVHRVGGSKSTIYGYYPSKEALFLAVTQAAGEKHIQSAFDELAAHDVRVGIRDMLGQFSEKLVVLLCSQELAATHRMVLAEAGHSNVGELFYEAGPKRGILDIAEFFRRAMEHGRMRQEDPAMAAQQFIALVQAEIQPRWYYKELPPLTDEQIKGIADRAMSTFSRAYALEPNSTMGAEPPDRGATLDQGAAVR